MLTILISLVVIAVCVVILSVLTEEFFAVSLEEIAEKLEMPSSVAGATLMAIGSSAPELLIALLALFQGDGKHVDVGIGTIVGSAIFNILVITGASAMMMTLHVRLRVFMRDAGFYLLSIGLLVWVIQDGEVTFYEPLIFFGLYVAYLILLWKWKISEHPESPQAAEEKEKISLEVGEEEVGKITYFLKLVIRPLTGDPLVALTRSFLVSVALIGVLCFVLVEAAIHFSDAAGIPPLIVALTLLAGGTSVPDMIASMISAKKGKGEMAVANAIGSNIFDILIGLGVPWFIAMVYYQAEVKVAVESLWSSMFLLIGSVILIIMLLLPKKQLSRTAGVILLLSYVLYVFYILWTS